MYILDKWLELVRCIEDVGVYFLCIKDMAGLLTPRAASLLVGALRQEHPMSPFMSTLTTLPEVELPV